jgi:hypothetical protein
MSLAVAVSSLKPVRITSGLNFFPETSIDLSADHQTWDNSGMDHSTSGFAGISATANPPAFLAFTAAEMSC